MDNPTKSRSTKIAQRLRRDATPAERKLWNSLRLGQMAGLGFRRQQPIGRYVVDFFCAKSRLVVELDGASHEDKAEADELRQQFLESQGLRVIRFLNQRCR